MLTYLVLDGSFIDFIDVSLASMKILKQYTFPLTSELEY